MLDYALLFASEHEATIHILTVQTLVRTVSYGFLEI